MKKHLPFLIPVLFCLFTTGLLAQDNSSDPEVLCAGSVRPYRVDKDENGGAGTAGSTYTWSITPGSFAGSITTNQGPSGSSNRILVDWGASPVGNYVIEVVETAAGGCPGTPVLLNVQITASIVPVFDPIGPFCQNGVAPALPTTSTNGISGTWSPATINTGTTGTTTYTFTPNAGQCAAITTIDVTISPLPATSPIFHD